MYAHSTDEARRRAARSVEVKVDLEGDGDRGTVTKCGTVEDEEGEKAEVPESKEPQKSKTPRRLRSSGVLVPRDRVELPTRGFSVLRGGKDSRELGVKQVTSQ